MSARLVAGIEAVVELIASASLAGAAAFAAYALLTSRVGQAELRLLALGAGCAGFLLSRMIMRAARTSKLSFRPPIFELAELEFGDFATSVADFQTSDELLLTDSDRLDCCAEEAIAEPLVLDDVLAKISPDSRVVRLFDRKSMPTPGQLQTRIDDHLAGIKAPVPDASQALSEALAELRRSLRQ